MTEDEVLFCGIPSAWLKHFNMTKQKILVIITVATNGDVVFFFLIYRKFSKKTSRISYKSNDSKYVKHIVEPLKNVNKQIYIKIETFQMNCTQYNILKKLYSLNITEIFTWRLDHYHYKMAKYRFAKNVFLTFYIIDYFS